MTTVGKTMLNICAVTAMFAGTVAPAAAQTMRTEGPRPDNPISVLADRLMPHDEFVLNSDEDIELIRYKTPRDVEICIARPDPSAAYGTRKAVPVRVTWDNETGTIWPGNCLSFDARSVKLRPAAPLPNDTELLGRFRVLH